MNVLVPASLSRRPGMRCLGMASLCGRARRCYSFSRRSVRTISTIAAAVSWRAFYASAVSAYVVAHHLSPSAFNPLAAIHGYHVAFWIGSGR